MQKSLTEQIYDELFLKLSKEKVFNKDIIGNLKKAVEKDEFKNTKIITEILKAEKIDGK